MVWFWSFQLHLLVFSVGVCCVFILPILSFLGLMLIHCMEKKANSVSDFAALCFVQLKNVSVLFNIYVATVLASFFLLSFNE